MPEMEYSFLSELTQTELIHFNTLKRIRPNTPTDKQLQLIESLARTLTSKRLLTLIARTPHWLSHGPILEALAENEFTPDLIRRDLEMVISLFILIRELDKSPLEEKEFRTGEIRSFYHELPANLKPIIKQQAHLLAKQINPSGRTMELPPLPHEEQDWENLTSPPEESNSFIDLTKPPINVRIERAQKTHLIDELVELLQDKEQDVRKSAFQNQNVNESIILKAIASATQTEFLEEVYAEARWYFRSDIRLAIYNSPYASNSLCKKLFTTMNLVRLLGVSVFTRIVIKSICALFAQLDETEFQYLTYLGKSKHPQLMRIIKLYYDNLQRRRSSQSLGRLSDSVEYNWSSMEERIYAACQTTQPEYVAQSLKDSDLKIFQIALENPILSTNDLLAIIPSLNQHKAELLASNSKWKENKLIQESLLHCSMLSESTSKALLKNISNVYSLIDLLRDSRLPHISIRQRAQEMLKEIYITMTVPQRIVLLRNSGGEIIRHLSMEVLKDEQTLFQLISDRQVDPSILIRLARNKQTPGSILEKIASHPVLMAHPAIMIELLINPNTPKESSVRIWGLLTEIEQEQISKNHHLPIVLRELA